MKYRFIQVEWGAGPQDWKYVCEVKKHWWNDWKPIVKVDGKTRIFNVTDTTIVNNILD